MKLSNYYRKETDEDGNVRYYNKNNQLHRINGPAVIRKDGSKYWYKNGKTHRLDGPALEYSDGDRFWSINGELHRLDGPAVIYQSSPNEDKFWYIDGVFIGRSADGFTEEDFEKYKSDHNIK